MNNNPTPRLSDRKSNRTQPILKRVAWSGLVPHLIDEEFDEGTDLYLDCILGRRELI